ncbi:MAG: HAD family hydrolase [Proteobacteria bacterium]|nr:HAD family hydrolase [Pseudomonadota bacterium]
MKYSHIIWDWNGTLIDDAQETVNVVNRQLRKRQLPETTLARYREIYEHPVKKIYDRLGFTLDEQSWPQFVDEWFTDYNSKVTGLELHHDAHDTLMTFKDRGCVQAILSALPHELLTHCVEHHGVAPFFHTVMGLQDRFGASKVANGSWVMQQISADPSRTVVIGDSSHDFEVAHALKIDCLLVCRGLESRARLESNGCPVFEDFAGLKQHLFDEYAF